MVKVMFIYRTSIERPATYGGSGSSGGSASVATSMVVTEFETEIEADAAIDAATRTAPFRLDSYSEQDIVAIPLYRTLRS